MNIAIQATCNAITLSEPKRKKLKALLKKLKGEALQRDFSWGLSSVVDSCTFLIEFLEGKHD